MKWPWASDRFIRWHSLLAVVALLSSARPADSAYVTGQVVDRFGGIPSANVMVLGTRLGAITDACGHFEIVASMGDTITIQAQALGYEKAVRTISFRGAAAPVTLTLRGNLPWVEPSCDTAFTVDYMQQDHRSGIGRGMICSFDPDLHIKPATHSGSLGFLQLSDLTCGVGVRWSVSGPLDRLEVQDERRRPVHTFLNVPRSGALEWDGRVADGSLLPPGVYQLVASSGRESLSLESSRWLPDAGRCR